MKKARDTEMAAVCYGEILWDVLPDGPQPGGAPLNVAYHLNKIGLVSGLISRIGSDENGRKLSQLMDQWRINKDLLQVDEEHATSQVLARMNNGNEVTYEIVFPVAWDFIVNSTELKSALKPVKYFIYGSLASRNDISRNTLIELLETGAVKVFDINIRPPFVDRSLLEILLNKADIVKFNEAELSMAQTMFGGSYEGESQMVKFIQEHFNVPEIVVTKGEFGASYYKQNHSYHVWGSEVKVIDTIGSGDSFLAAFIASHASGEHPKELLMKAIAMGGFIATKKGGCPQYEITEYNDFKNQIFRI